MVKAHVRVRSRCSVLRRLARKLIFLIAALYFAVHDIPLSQQLILQVPSILQESISPVIYLEYIAIQCNRLQIHFTTLGDGREVNKPIADRK